MEALDFRPSIAARTLSGAKSGQIALIYDNFSPYYMFQIQLGCRDVCKERGVRLLAQPVDVADANVGEQIRGLVTETHVTGIVLSSPVTDCDAANDDMVAGVLAVAHDRNIELPDALSVAGFDDTTLARTVWPPLTTTHQPMADLARTATEILMNGGDFSHRRLPHHLIERASIAPPKRKSL